MPSLCFALTLISYLNRITKDRIKEEIRIEEERLRKFKEKEKQIKLQAKIFRMHQYKDVSICIPVERLRSECVVENTLDEIWY